MPAQAALLRADDPAVDGNSGGGYPPRLRDFEPDASLCMFVSAEEATAENSAARFAHFFAVTLQQGG